MNTGGLVLVLGAIGAATMAFIWLALKVGKGGGGNASGTTDLEQSARTDVEHIFNADFREELRNRGRLHFEKIIGENAMFLQQDLRQTTAQLNEYMRTEITKTLQDEFKKYEQSIVDAKQIALESIEKTTATIDQQRTFLQQQMTAQVDAQKKKIVETFDREMARIVNHYILRSIGSQIDLTDQLEYILTELEANKAAIIEDIQRGT